MGKRITTVSIDRKFQMEMGGKNPKVALDDADLTVAVEAVAPRREEAEGYTALTSGQRFAKFWSNERL